MTSFQRLAPCNDFSTSSAASDLLIRFELSFLPASTLSAIDIVGNGFGRWNTIPTLRRTATGSTPGPYRFLPVDDDLAVDVCALDHLVHAVQRPQERRLATAGRPDQRGDRTRIDRHRDAFDRFEVAVVDVEITNVDPIGEVDGRVRIDRRPGVGGVGGADGVGHGSRGLAVGGAGHRTVHRSPFGFRMEDRIRAVVNKIITMRTSVSAAVHARSMLASGGSVGNLYEL